MIDSRDNEMARLNERKQRRLRHRKKLKKMTRPKNTLFSLFLFIFYFLRNANCLACLVGLDGLSKGLEWWRLAKDSGRKEKERKG